MSSYYAQILILGAVILASNANLGKHGVFTRHWPH